MKEIKKELKIMEKIIKINYIYKKDIEKIIQKLEKERNTLARNRTDRVYDNVETDRIIHIINIKIDTLREILGGK